MKLCRYDVPFTGLGTIGQTFAVYRNCHGVVINIRDPVPHDVGLEMLKIEIWVLEI